MHGPRFKIFTKQNSALLLLMAVSSSSQAAVFTYTEGYSVVGNTSYTENYYSPVLGHVSGTSLSTLPQFDTSQGSLESVTISINGSLSFDSYFQAQGNSNPSAYINANASFNIGVGVRSWVGGTFQEAFDLQNHSMSCSGNTGSSSCNSWETNSFNVNTSIMFTGTDVDDFIGSGDLGTSSSLGLYANLNSPIHLHNLNRAFLNINPIQFDGDITVEYSTSAVPVPAAVWLFGSALAGLGFTRKSKS